MNKPSAPKCNCLSGDSVDKRLFTGMSEDFSFCPFCGTKYAEPPKLLWEVARDTYMPLVGEEAWQAVITAVLDRVDEKIDLYFKPLSVHNLLDTKDKLKQSLREL